MEGPCKLSCAVHAKILVVASLSSTGCSESLSERVKSSYDVTSKGAKSLAWREAHITNGKDSENVGKNSRVSYSGEITHESGFACLEGRNLRQVYSEVKRQPTVIAGIKERRNNEGGRKEVETLMNDCV